MGHSDGLHVLGVHHVVCYRALSGGLASENIRGLRRGWFRPIHGLSNCIIDWEGKAP